MFTTLEVQAPLFPELCNKSFGKAVPRNFYDVIDQGEHHVHVLGDPRREGDIDDDALLSEEPGLLFG